MTTRHFDVVILGRSLGALATAALLSRRDFRVLLFGHGDLPIQYGSDELPLLRRFSSVLFSQTPVWRRILQDLAQSQTYRRCTVRPDPSYGVLASRLRLLVSPERLRLAAELRREFHDVTPLLEPLSQKLEQASSAFDEELARGKVWPPEGIWAKLMAGRASRQLPLTGLSAGDLLDRFPRSHPARQAVLLPAQFACNWGGHGESLSALSVARLSNQWLRQSVEFTGGEAALESFLIKRIEAHGGFCELGEKAGQVVFRRGKVAGVLAAGGERFVGTDAVVMGRSGHDLLQLSDVNAEVRPAESRGYLRSTQGRFIVCCLVRAEVIPAPLPRHCFFLAEGERPALQVQWLPVPNKPKLRWLVAETLAIPTDRRRLRLLRARVVEALRVHLPFLAEHLLACDSPHDGLPLDVYEHGRKTVVERVHIRGAMRAPESLEPLWDSDNTDLLGLAGEPVRGPFSSTYLVGTTAFPGLGQEGELLAAWAAAHWITRSDRTWQDRRRQMWTKIDTDLA